MLSFKVTGSNLWVSIIGVTGVKVDGIQFALELPDTSGSIKSATDIIRGAGGQIVSILSTHDRAPEGYRNVYIKTSGIDWDGLESIKPQIQEKARILYLIDHQENQREIRTG